MPQLTKSKNHITIAIDGPAGSGKSSIAKIIAEQLNFLYIDTGAMYRALALKVIDNDFDITQDKIVEELIKTTTLSYNNDAQLVVDNKIVDNRIRSDQVTHKVSQVAAISPIRTFLVDCQRQLGSQFNSILDGRDIGTVVFPNANLKIFLTATIEIRAQRRFLQNQTNNQNSTTSITDLQSAIANRDQMDRSRKVGALKQAKDAILIDNSNLTLAQTIAKITKLIQKIIIKDVK